MDEVKPTEDLKIRLYNGTSMIAGRAPAIHSNADGVSQSAAREFEVFFSRFDSVDISNDKFNTNLDIWDQHETFIHSTYYI